MGLRLLIAALLAAPPLLATLCYPRPIRVERFISQYVLRGTIERVDSLERENGVPVYLWPDTMIPVPRRFVATIRVAAVWKGVVGPTIRLHSFEFAGPHMGFEMKVGDDVLVFAAADFVSVRDSVVFEMPQWWSVVPVGTRILRTTGACGLSDHARNAAETIRALGRPRYFVHG